jgi:hypothetical protein
VLLGRVRAIAGAAIVRKQLQDEAGTIASD